MRKGMTGLAMLVQQGLSADPFDGAVFAFRGRRAGLIRLTYGYRRITALLNWARRSAGAEPVNHKRVFRLMSCIHPATAMESSDQAAAALC